jgi:predicted nucleotidyltransferase
MPRREEHCYRCGYVWAPRRRRVRICSRCKSPYFWLPKLRVPRYGGGLGIGEVIGPKRDEVLKVALRCGATNVRVFGSVARGAAGPTSDVDILVRPKSRKGFMAIDLALNLSQLLGRRVDVISESSLHWLIEPQVIAEAVPL